MVDKAGLKDEYVERLLERVGIKLSAKRLDDTGKLGERVEFNEEEDLAYEYIMLKADKRIQMLAYKRYFADEYVDAKGVYESLGISKRNYYSQRREMLDRLDSYLTDKGYGYDNASRDRVGLPDKLNNGRYIRSGVDFVHEDTDGDLYNLSQGALDLQRYNEIRVVPTIELLLTYIDVDEVELKGSDGSITECYLVKDGKAGLGVLVKVNSAIYDGLLDVFTELEQELDDLLGFDEVNELLKLAVVVEFDKPFEDNWLE